MARVKRGVVSKRKHNKLRDLNKGYKGTRSRLTKDAKEAMLHAGAYAYAGRKDRKGDFRTLWITRISEATKKSGMSYSVFINNLKKTNITLNRKVLADLVVNDNATFKKIVDTVKSN
jgi:large subunit ribosomal protein L20